MHLFLAHKIQESIYQIFDQDQRGIQYSQQECEAWSHCKWHCLSLDMGCDFAAVEHSSVRVWSRWAILGDSPSRLSYHCLQVFKTTIFLL